MSLVSMLKGTGPSGFGYGSTAEDVTQDLDLSGSTILVTGISSGIGFETMRVLALHGARVVAAARTEEKAREASGKVVGVTLPVACELTDPASIMACVDLLEAEGVLLDGVVCNAGIMADPEAGTGVRLRAPVLQQPRRSLHPGHTAARSTDRGRARRGREQRCSPSGPQRRDRIRQPLWSPRLPAIARVRPVQTRQPVVRQGARAALRRHRENRQRGAPGGHLYEPGTKHAEGRPGGLAVASPLVLKSVGQGAATQCFVATQPDLATSGAYFADCNVARSSSLSRDPDLARRLWDESERIAREVMPR